ncbi:MAG: hypothetical protein Q9163_004048 [Psora crenata]
MSTFRAAVLSSHSSPIALQTLPKPEVTPGSVLVRILAVSIIPYTKEVLDGSREYPLAFPIVPGGLATGRVEEVGPDAVRLTPGQLVFCDFTINGRDDPTVQILMGFLGGAPGSPEMKLMEGEWRNGTFSELAKFPLENVFPMDEDILVKQRGYSFADLCHMGICMVPYGGLAEINVKPGDTVIVAPATGKFGGAAVNTLIAMGATAIAAGRNEAVLKALESTYAATGRIKIVTLTGDEAKDTEAFKKLTPQGAGADAYIDLSPPAAAKSTHIAAAIAAIKAFGSVMLMGGILGNIEIPYSLLVFKNLRLQGKLMYERAQIQQMIKLAEAGNLPLGQDSGVQIEGPYGLDKLETALDKAAESPNWGSMVVLAP